MSDRWAVALALAVAAGAWSARAAPLPVAVAFVALGFAARRPALLCLGAALASSALAARSWAGLVPPEPGTPAVGVATLVSDPVDVGAASTVRVELRLGGRRVEAEARGAAAAALRERLAGERVAVAGRLAAVTGRRRAHLVRHHVAARLHVERIGGWSPGDRLTRLANDVRRTLVRGMASLDPDDRALVSGVVLGDDRDQSVATTDDFRAAGLSHLLAVSGQNVAFVLALAAPLLSRLGLRARMLAGLAVLAAFGVLTRWEPSVLRAVAMAGLSITAATLGRPVSTVRLLALAVAGLLLVDPLLVGSVGFLLSVAACAGIAALATPIGARLPGPRSVTAPLAVTLAAQTGVAPVVVGVFGGLPLASVPANLLAGVAAGPVMVWGLVAGLPAGLAGGTAAAALHAPTRLLIGWVAGVARWAAGLPLGELGPAHLVALVAIAVAAVALPPARRPAPALVATVALLPAATVTLTGPPPASALELAGGAELWRAGRAVVLVVDRPDPAPLLRALRSHHVRRVDLLVARRGGPAAARALAPVLARVPARVVLAPPGHRVVGTVEAVVGSRLVVGGLVVEVTAVTPRVEAEVAAAGGRRPGRV
jgi:competence protein ComEC